MDNVGERLNQGAIRYPTIGGLYNISAGECIESWWWHGWRWWRWWVSNSRSLVLPGERRAQWRAPGRLKIREILEKQLGFLHVVDGHKLRSPLFLGTTHLLDELWAYNPWFSTRSLQVQFEPLIPMPLGHWTWRVVTWTAGFGAGECTVVLFGVETHSQWTSSSVTLALFVACP